jgi:uncharacterized protein YutE (UPF0331/DUF86 family)
MSKDYKITFPIPECVNHDRETVHESLGLTDEEIENFLERFASYLSKIDTPSKLVENLMKDGVTEKELMYLLSMSVISLYERVLLSQTVASISEATGEDPESIIKKMRDNKFIGGGDSEK